MATPTEPSKTGTGNIIGPTKLQESMIKTTHNAADMAAELTEQVVKTTMEIKPPKRMWLRILRKLFKGKTMDATNASLLPNTQSRDNGLEVSTSPSEIAPATTSLSPKGTLYSTAEGKVANGKPGCGVWFQSPSIKQPPSTINGEAGTRVNQSIASQAAASVGQAIEGSRPDEHTINGLRSGGGKFTRCCPMTYKSNARDPNLSNVHTLFFSSDHGLTVKAEPLQIEIGNEYQARCNSCKLCKGCPPISPKSWKKAPKNSNSKVNRDENRKLTAPLIVEVDDSHGHKSKKGCFSLLGRKTGELELNSDPKTNLTYLDIDEDGNYGSGFNTGRFQSQDLTYLEFEKCGRYEPSVQDSAMTYLNLDDEGKYESSVELKKMTNVFGEPAGNTIQWEKGGHKPRGRSKVYPSTSITSLESDENDTDLFLSPDQPNSYGSPMTNPLPIMRQPVPGGVPGNNLNFHLKVDATSDRSVDDVKLENPSRGLDHETEPPDKGGYHLKKGCLPKWGQKCDHQLKEGTLRAAFAFVEVDETGTNKARSDDVLSDPSVQDRVVRTQQKEKGVCNFRNACLGHQQSKKDSPKKALMSTRSEDISYKEYSVDVELTDPWRGEQVAESELKDFRRLKSKKGCLPFGHKPRKGYPETTSSLIRAEENSDVDCKVEAGLEDRKIDQGVFELQWEDATDCKPSNGCLSFGQTPKYFPETTSTSIESDRTSDYRAEVEQEVATSHLLEFAGLKTEMDGTETVIISIESDDDSDDRATTEVDDEVAEPLWENSCSCKPQKGCLAFSHKKRKDFSESTLNSMESEVNSYRANVQSNSPKRAEVVPARVDLNGSKPKNGCLPFGGNQRKDNPVIVASIESDNVELDDNQMEQDVGETHWQDVKFHKPKKKCPPFDHQKDNSGAVVTSTETADTINGTDTEKDDLWIGEDTTERPLLSERQEYSGNKSKVGWFSSGCLSNRPALSASFGTDETGLNQVRLDLELSGTEVHGCLPFARKSRKGKLLYVQSGEDSGNDFSFDLDLDDLLMDEVDETNGNMESGERSRNGCLPPSLKLSKGHPQESLTHMQHDDKRNIVSALHAQNLAAGKRAHCADHIFNCMKQKSIHAQTGFPSGPGLGIISELTFPDLEEELHELAKTDCAGLSRKRSYKQGLEKCSNLPDSVTEATMAFIDPILEEKVGTAESGKTYCRRSARKLQAKTGSELEAAVDESGRTSCGGLSMTQDPTKGMEGAVDGSGEVGCGRFLAKQDGRNQMEVEVNESGKTCGGRLLMGRDLQKQFEETGGESVKTTCGRLFSKRDPETELKEGVDGSGKTSCGSFSMKQDVRDMFEVKVGVDAPGKIICGRFTKKDPRQQLVVAVDESGKTSGNFYTNQDPKLFEPVDEAQKIHRGSFLMNRDPEKQLEEVVDESGKTSCGRFSMNRGGQKQFEHAVDELGSSCRRLSVNQNAKYQFDVEGGESGWTACGRLSTKQDPQKQSKETVNESGRASCIQLSTNQVASNCCEVEGGKSGRTSCGRLALKRDTRKQVDEAMDTSGRASCSTLPTKLGPKRQTEETVDEPRRASCGGLSMKQQATKEFEVEVDKSGRTSCGRLPLIQEAKKLFEEGMDESRRISCGGFSLKREPRKKSAKVVDKSGQTNCGGFSITRDPWKQFQAMEVECKGADNPAWNLTESTQEKVFMASEELQTHNPEGTHESEFSPLINNGGQSQKGFLRKYFACMDINDTSSNSSKCTFEAAVIEESIRDNSNLNTGRIQKAGSGHDCINCVPHANVKEMHASPDTSGTFNCSIQSSVPNFSDNTYGTTFHNGPNDEIQQVLTLERLDADSNSGNWSCSTCKRANDQKGNVAQPQPSQGFNQMKPFGKCSIQTRKERDFPATSQVDLTTWQPAEDKEVGHVANPSQRCNRERWIPCKGKDLVARISQSLDFKKDPELSFPKMELRPNKDDESHWLHLEGEGSAPHACDTFRPYKMAGTSLPDMYSTSTRRNLGDVREHCEKIESADLILNYPTKQCTGDSCLGTEWNRSETHVSKDSINWCPENKWLRTEGMEHLAEQSKASTEELQDDSLLHDEAKILAQASKLFRKKPRDNLSNTWRRKLLAYDLSASMEGNHENAWQQHTGKEGTSEKFMGDNDNCLGDGWERIEGTEMENDGMKATKPPVPRQAKTYTQKYCEYTAPQHDLTEYETQGLSGLHPQGETEASEVYTRTCSYKRMESDPGYLRYESAYKQLECNPDKEQLEVHQTSVDLNHQCLGRNWQRWQKEESIAQALEASESLLHKLLPIRLPDFESSGQEESSLSGFSQQRGKCCLLSMCPTKEKKKSRHTQTKQSEIEAPTVYGQYTNQQTNEEIANLENNPSQIILESTEICDTFLQQSIPQTVCRVKGTRNIRHSTPVGGSEDCNTGPSNLGTSLKKYQQFDKSKKKNEDMVQSTEALDKAKSASHTSHLKGAFYKTRNIAVQAAEQVVPEEVSAESLGDVKSDNTYLDSKIPNKGDGHDKPQPRVELKLNSGNTKTKVQNRAACIPKFLTCTRSQGEDDPQGVKHQAQSVSGGTKTHGRKLKIYTSLKKRPFIEPKTSATEDSSSDEDIYDAASKKFRDDLFRNKPAQHNFLATKCMISPQAVALNTDYQKTTKSQKIDHFCGSPVFQELIKVESQMREIAKIITSLTGCDYLKPGEDLNDQNMDSNGGLETQDDPIHEKEQLSVYRNPLWFAEWQEPVSIQMATRLAEDEVPVYYEDGFKVGYIPIECRSSRGMRKRMPIHLLDKEYSKFTNIKTYATSHDDVNHEVLKRHPKKRYSKNFTAKKILHEKTHPYHHRSSEIQDTLTLSTPNYSSSSSSWSWKEDLIQSHRRVFCQNKEAMALRKKTAISEDSDSTDSFLPSKREKPDVFMKQVDEELARLTIAKMQLNDLSPGSLNGAQLSHKLKGDFMKGGFMKGGCIRVAPDNEEDSLPEFVETGTATGINRKSLESSAEVVDEDSPCLGWTGRYMSPVNSRAESPTKTRRALENKEFQLLERRVQKELGRKRKITYAKPTQHLKEEMSKSSEQVGNFRSQHVANLGTYHPKIDHTLHVTLGPPAAGNDLENAAQTTSSVDQLNSPVSSLVKLMFGTQKTDYGSEGGQETANILLAAEAIIQKKVGALEAEILNFKNDNKRLRVMIKENAEHMSQLMQEKEAWELQKNSDLEAFQHYKHAQMNKLQKEKCKVEHQTRALLQLPKERKEIDGLKAKLAEEHEEHLRKELQWHQTSTRLRGVNSSLKNQIYELRKEIARHEEWLLLDMASEDSASDSTVRPSRVKTQKAWNANTLTDNDSTVKHCTEKARKAWNANICTSDLSEAGHPTKVQVKLIRKPQHPTRVKVEVVKNLNNHDPKHPKDVKDTTKTAKDTTKTAKDTLGSCKDATTALAQKMKHLEKEVEQWITIHSQHQKPGPHFEGHSK